jgi:glycine dehydrogenase subunit 2
MDLIFEKSRPGRTAGNIPVCDVPEIPLDQVIDQRLLRQDVDLPEISAWMWGFTRWGPAP